MHRHVIRSALFGVGCAFSLQLVAEPQEYPSEAGTVRVKEIITGLENPWDWPFCRTASGCW